MGGARALPAGSIPACAGKPPRQNQGCTIARVYPRVCGETRPHQNLDERGRGLSPRVRGNLPNRHQKIVPIGSIPACAGKPEMADYQLRPKPVYPRVCGETGGLPTGIAAASGLSPRVRGNLWRLTDRWAQVGSIPACAGKPGTKSAGPPASRVYPRVCGETTWTRNRRRHRRGLSPRVRGNLLRQCQSL